MTIAQTDAAKQIRSNVQAFERNVKAQDVASLVEGFYADDGMVMPPDQPSAKGKTKITEFWQGMFSAGLTEAKLTIEQLEDSGDLAVEIGRYELVVGGGQAAGKYLVVHRRQANGSWRAIADMFSGNGPG